jgi:arginase
MKQKHILPAPFALSPHGYTAAGTAYREIVGGNGTNGNNSNYFPSNLLQKNCVIHSPVEFNIFENDQPHIGHHLKSLEDLQLQLSRRVAEILPQSESLAILGGDHSISVGTGLGLSKCLDMADVGLIWIDAHADSNTPETSLSKCLTGYPAAINAGWGPKTLIEPFQGNIIQNVVQIGLRDIDELEQNNVSKINTEIFSILDIVELGMKQVIDRALLSLTDCKYIWLSIDIDSLDSIYFQPGETDVPCPGGLSPRELLYLVSRIRQSGKLIVTELTQVNDLGCMTPITVLSSRILEMALGIGQFRYGLPATIDTMSGFTARSLAVAGARAKPLTISVQEL